jgi:hypothetical protein
MTFTLSFIRCFAEQKDRVTRGRFVGEIILGYDLNSPYHSLPVK